MLKMQVIVLCAERFSIADEKTGEVNEGISFQYIGTDNLHPITEGNLRGIRVIKEWLPASLNDKIPVCPALYNATINMKVNAAGKSSLKLVDLEFVKEFK